MSREPGKAAERIRTFFEAFNRRDWDAFYAELDPDVEYTPVEEGVVYRARAGLAEYLQHWLEEWDRFVAEPEEIKITPAEDRGFVAIRFRGTGRASGVEIHEYLFWGADLRDGRLHLIREFTARDEALDAVGLSE
jgi:ketosteroid isomerase-like protein